MPAVKQFDIIATNREEKHGTVRDRGLFGWVCHPLLPEDANALRLRHDRYRFGRSTFGQNGKFVFLGQPMRIYDYAIVGLLLVLMTVAHVVHEHVTDLSRFYRKS